MIARYGAESWAEPGRTASSLALQGRGCGRSHAHGPAAPPPRADFGFEQAVSLEGLSKADVEKQLEAAVKNGEDLPRSAESEGEPAA